MADDGIFATNAEILRKAGAGASSTSSAIAFTDDYVTQVESYINVLSGHNWSDAYASLSVDVKGILKEAATNMVAIYVIQYDTEGYGSDRRAENIININWKRFIQCCKLLNEQDTILFMTKAVV